MNRTTLQKIIDVVQWVLIVLLVGMLIAQHINFMRLQKDLVTNEEYIKNNTYIKIYESRRLLALKTENRLLYDSISKLKSVESAMSVKFKQIYNTDTIWVDRFTKTNDDINNTNDSVYHYVENNDTVNLNISLKARDLAWIKTNFTLTNNFIIINRERNGINQTLIKHNPNTIIDNTSMWHRIGDGKKWYEKIIFTPQVGIGYGIINKRPDLYVGFGISYNF